MPSSVELFRSHPNEWFVETGTLRGEGIETAIASGFKHIFSIELSDQLAMECQKKYAQQTQVKIIAGDSSTVLEDILVPILKPITFWLDAHYSGGETARGDCKCPILKELSVIARHPVKRHTILIDDLRMFGTPIHDGITFDQLLKSLLKINPDYCFSLHNGIEPRDILAATP